MPEFMVLGEDAQYDDTRIVDPLLQKEHPQQRREQPSVLVPLQNEVVVRQRQAEPDRLPLRLREDHERRD